MTVPAPITVTPVFVADLHVEGERMPIYVHVIDHPDARRPQNADDDRDKHEGMG